MPIGPTGGGGGGRTGAIRRLWLAMAGSGDIWRAIGWSRLAKLDETIRNLPMAKHIQT